MFVVWVFCFLFFVIVVAVVLERINWSRTLDVIFARKGHTGADTLYQLWLVVTAGPAVAGDTDDDGDDRPVTCLERYFLKGELCGDSTIIIQ